MLDDNPVEGTLNANAAMSIGNFHKEDSYENEESNLSSKMKIPSSSKA